MISAENLTKTYVLRTKKGLFTRNVKKIQALQGVSFEIQMPFVENEPVTKIDSQKTRNKGSVGTTKSEKTINNLKRYDRLSDSEKKRTAKEILCFIYLLNEKHVLAHLDGCSNVQSNLSKWCNDVKNKVGA